MPIRVPPSLRDPSVLLATCQWREVSQGVLAPVNLHPQHYTPQSCRSPKMLPANPGGAKGPKMPWPPPHPRSGAPHRRSGGETLVQPRGAEGGTAPADIHPRPPPNPRVPTPTQLAFGLWAGRPALPKPLRAGAYAERRAPKPKGCRPGRHTLWAPATSPRPPPQDREGAHQYAPHAPMGPPLPRDRSHSEEGGGTRSSARVPRGG